MSDIFFWSGGMLLVLGPALYGWTRGGKSGRGGRIVRAIAGLPLIVMGGSLIMAAWAIRIGAPS